MKFYLQCLVSILLLVLPFHFVARVITYDQVPKLLQMSDTLRLLGKYDRALTLAEESEKVAKRKAHWSPGFGLNKLKGTRLCQWPWIRKTPDDRFQKSNDLLVQNWQQNTAPLDNFNQLKTLATACNDKRALAGLDYSVSKIRKVRHSSKASAQAEKLKEIYHRRRKGKDKSEKDKIESEKTKLKWNVEESKPRIPNNCKRIRKKLKGK